MVIKIFVVGFLAVHILRHLLQGTFPGQPFPMKQLQLPPGAYHTITATIDFDFSGLGQGKTSLAPAERLRQRDDLAFLLVDRDAADLKLAHDSAAQIFQIFDIRENDAVIIHVVSGAMRGHLAFDPVVHSTGHWTPT